MSRRIFDWSPIAILALANLVLSSDKFNATSTGRRFSQLLDAFAFSPETVEWMHHMTRKSGHFLGYALLTLFLVRAIRVVDPLKRAALAAGVVLVWCLLDEYRQSWTRLRGGSLNDAMVDFCGGLTALAALGVVYLVRRWSSRSRQ